MIKEARELKSNKELYLGEYYVITVSTENKNWSDRFIIFTPTKCISRDDSRIMSKCVGNFDSTYLVFNTDQLLYVTADRKVRSATAEEQEWLKICIRENRFVPKEEIPSYLFKNLVKEINQELK